MEAVKQVDARGLACPMPVVRLKKAMDGVRPGQVVELLATDRGSVSDVRAWAQNGGHQLLEVREADGVFVFRIRKARPVAVTVDARGLACPMPIVRARKAIDAIRVGEVMEVLATDRGAPADFRNWCLQTDQKFLELTEAEGHFRLLIKKVVADTREKERVFPHELSNAELAALLGSASGPIIVDVREAHEYAAGHIPGALLLPIEEIESWLGRFDPAAAVAVVCRSGRRSDYACQILAQHGFTNAKNVVPGMSEWTGPVEIG